MVKDKKENPMGEYGFWAIIEDIKAQLILLAFSGVGGAFVRALFLPEESWKLKLTQGIGGAVSAIFLGGFMAQMTDTLLTPTPYSWLAWGFVMGSGGEVAIKAAQKRLQGIS